MCEKIDLKEICKEIRCEETYSKSIDKLNESERYYLDIDLENNYKNMKKEFKNLMIALNIDINDYINGNKIEIPIEDKAFCKRAYQMRKSSIAKKIRGVSKKDITLEEIENELKEIGEVALNTMQKEVAEFELGKIAYAQNYQVLKRIEQVKVIAEKYIYDKMLKIRNDDISLSGEDAICLIDYYILMIKGISEQWDKIVENYKDIRDADVDSRIICNEETGEYYVDKKVELLEPIDVLAQALMKI
jgi:hypothetical protein